MNDASPVRCVMCFVCILNEPSVCVVCVVASNGNFVFLDFLVAYVTNRCDRSVCLYMAGPGFDSPYPALGKSRAILPAGYGNC